MRDNHSIRGRARVVAILVLLGACDLGPDDRDLAFARAGTNAVLLGAIARLDAARLEPISPPRRSTGSSICTPVPR